MEEEFKRIECLIERCNQCKLNACITCDICWSEVQAIENLIKAYRELEEENARIGMLNLVQEDMIKELENNYIPKSKIQEKKEELEEKSKHCAISDLTEYFCKKEILNELLED